MRDALLVRARHGAQQPLQQHLAPGHGADVRARGHEHVHVHARVLHSAFDVFSVLFAGIYSHMYCMFDSDDSQ